MQERRNQAIYYVNAVIKDMQNAFVREETTVFSEAKIVREYEFEDGAVIKYEWQNEASSTKGEKFNHRFTLLKVPTPNTGNLKTGIIKTIEYK